MTDCKFTDDDVIETLKNAKYKVDGVVTRGFYLSPETFNAVVDLIGRQKAEIERLQSMNQAKLDTIHDIQADNERLEKAVDNYEACLESVEKIRAKAIKEFAENVKAIFECVLYFDDDVKECILNEIDELVKEMTEEKTNEFSCEST